MFFSIDGLQLRYDPFPIGLVKPLMKPEIYTQLADNYPPQELFKSYDYLGKEGKKFTLSDRENPSEYYKFLRMKPVWKQFHEWITSDDFTYGVIETLRDHDVDLGFKYISPGRRIVKRIKALARGHLCPGAPRLKSRFDFSMMPADGGNQVPHTDATRKIVTLVVSMAREGEWDPAFGGGTDVNRPKSTRLSFNHVNRPAGFDEMEILDTYDYTPNQAVVFVKTFNSWHSVRPMTGTASTTMRKTLTINIETLS